jgi:hypothetical protein
MFEIAQGKSGRFKVVMVVNRRNESFAENLPKVIRNNSSSGVFC